MIVAGYKEILLTSATAWVLDVEEVSSTVISPESFKVGAAYTHELQSQ